MKYLTGKVEKNHYMRNRIIAIVVILSIVRYAGHSGAFIDDIRGLFSFISKAPKNVERTFVHLVKGKDALVWYDLREEGREWKKIGRDITRNVTSIF